MSDKLDEIRALVEKDLFYPVYIPGVGEIPGMITAAEAGNHYGIQNMRDKTVLTFGPQAYLFAALAKGFAKSVVHVGTEPLMTKVGEMVGFEVKEAFPGRADIVFYGGPMPSAQLMERLKAHASGPMFIETPPEKDPSDQVMYELAVQRAGMVAGFLGYPGMGFDTNSTGRPALFVARRRTQS